MWMEGQMDGWTDKTCRQVKVNNCLKPIPMALNSFEDINQTRHQDEIAILKKKEDRFQE